MGSTRSRWVEQLRREYRRQTRQTARRATIGSAEGVVYDPEVPGNVFVRYAGAPDSDDARLYSPVASVRLQARITGTPGEAVLVGPDLQGQLAVIGADFDGQLSQGQNPIASNVSDRRLVDSAVTQSRLATLLSHPLSTPDTDSLSVAVRAWIYVDSGGTWHEFLGAAVDLTSYVPSTSNEHRLAGLFLKTDDTVEVVASTAKSLAAPLGLEDVQECFDGRSTDATPVWFWRLLYGQTRIDDTHSFLDGRQLVNVGGLAVLTFDGLADVDVSSPNNGDVPTWNSGTSLWEAAAPSGGGTVDPRTCNARLTLETGVPKSTSDQLAKGTLYLTPYEGQLIALYNGTSWEYVTLSADLSIALSGGTASKPHDVFLDYNGGTPQLALVAWTDDTTRASALGTQDGVAVLGSDPTQRHFGIAYLDASKQCSMRFYGGYAASAAAECGLWNANNQLPQEFIIEESTSVWTVTAGTSLQAWHSSAYNRVNFVYGKAEKRVLLRFWGLQSVATSGHAIVDIMLDSTTTSSADIVAGSNSTATILTVAYAEYNNFPSVGRHYLQLGELANTTYNTNFYGRGAGALNFQYGGFMRIWS